ncbi:MAG: substrate-binding domain-containing protein [Capsulimonas sp.]|uniref:substrate-binding domain-containing protein n=1 Tax=Capsulimonas sp. TaxID=2494211 RepID=UPI003266765B
MDTIKTQTQSDVCPYCESEIGQVKAGISQGVQRYKCMHCQRRYIRDKKERGYPRERREQAIHLHLLGLKDRQIARQLEVTAPTVAHWVRSWKAALPPPSSAPPDPIAKDAFAGRERVTISDVARLANVSVTTISNHLNGRGHMREDTRRQVEAAIERLHFSPNALIRAIRKRRTRIIGVLLFGVNNLAENMGESITPGLLAGMHIAADRAEYDILLYTGWPQRPKRSSGLDFLNGSADGLIWVAPSMSEPVLERIASAGLPVISLLSRHVPDPVGCVNLDNFGAMRELVRHLVELGHRRIAYAGPVHASNYLDRRDGYREALAAHGLAWDPELEFVHAEPSWEERVSLPALELIYLPTLERWSKHPDPPTAVFAADFTLAAGVISAVRRLGRRVPEDISVCGFDDSPVARSIAGGLTTIRQPYRRMGELAVEGLIALIEAPSISQRHIMAPGSLVLGATTSRRQ